MYFSYFADINECLQMSHNCRPDFECVNTEGSFTCSPKPGCSVGFEQDAQGNCIGKENQTIILVCTLRQCSNQLK